MLKLKKMQMIAISILLSGSILLGCSNKAVEKETRELNIFAAASLTDSLGEIETNFEKTHEGIDIVLNLASSGSLQKQIQQGAPADVFFSASKKKLESVVESGEIEKQDVVELLKNNLVVVTPDASEYLPSSLNDLDSEFVKKISIAAPDSAPAGRYAKESLENAKLFEKLKEKMVYGKNVRQTLSYVETGEVEAGIVYSSDAAISKEGKIAFEIPEEMHSKIVYPVAAIKNAEDKALADEFVKYLQEDESKEIFVKYGFKIKED